MIKIPENKYSNLSEEHYNYICGYIKDSIQFYINCCDIWMGKLSGIEYTKKLTSNIKGERVWKLLNAICSNLPSDSKAEEFFKEKYKSQMLKQEFFIQIRDYKMFAL